MENKLPPKEDQRISRNAGSHVRHLRVADYSPEGIAAASYLAGATEEYFHHTPQPSPSTPLPETEGEEVPKMSEELAAESDMAAIGYGQMSDRFEPFELSDISDAFEAGQSWMWKRISQQLSSSTLRIEELEKELENQKGQWFQASLRVTEVVAENSDLRAQLSASQQEAREYREMLVRHIDHMRYDHWPEEVNRINTLLSKYSQPSTNTDKP